MTLIKINYIGKWLGSSSSLLPHLPLYSGRGSPPAENVHKSGGLVGSGKSFRWFIYSGLKKPEPNDVLIPPRPVEKMKSDTLRKRFAIRQSVTAGAIKNAIGPVTWDGAAGQNYRTPPTVGPIITSKSGKRCWEFTDTFYCTNFSCQQAEQGQRWCW